MCQREAGAVSTVQEEFDGKVRVLGVAGRGDLAELESFVSRFGVDRFEHLADVDGVIWDQFEVTSQPGFVFVNDDGSAGRAVVGALGVERLRERMQQLTAS